MLGKALWRGGQRRLREQSLLAARRGAAVVRLPLARAQRPLARSLAGKAGREFKGEDAAAQAKQAEAAEAEQPAQQEDHEDAHEPKQTQEEQWHKVLDDALHLVLPDDGHDEVKIAEWKVDEGQVLKGSQTVMEIETPEYSYEFQTSEPGTLVKQVVGNGACVKPRSLLGYMAKSEEQAEAVKAAYVGLHGADIIAQEGTGEEGVRKFLAGLESDLETYTDRLVEDGFDSIGALCTLTEEDMEAVGMKKGHRRVLAKALDKLTKAKESAEDRDAAVE